jgi:plasmid stability protein
LSEASKKRLRQRAVRHRRSLGAEVRAILERAAEESPVPNTEAERSPTGSSARPGGASTSMKKSTRIALEKVPDTFRPRLDVCFLPRGERAAFSRDRRGIDRFPAQELAQEINLR